MLAQTEKLRKPAVDTGQLCAARDRNFAIPHGSNRATGHFDWRAQCERIPWA
jgi:hypothetical protein